MPKWYDSALDRFSGNAQQIRERLSTIDIAVLGSSTSRLMAGESKAFAYVWLAAVLEQYVREVLESFTSELNSLSLPAGALRPELLAFVLRAELESVRDLRDFQKLWHQRCRLFQLATANVATTFESASLPLDGKSIRAYHFDTIWMVFGFQGPSVPTPLHRIALQDLADGRNAVAHGDVEPGKFGRSKVLADVLKLVGRVEDVAFHLALSADVYLSAQAYLA